MNYTLSYSGNTSTGGSVPTSVSAVAGSWVTVAGNTGTLLKTSNYFAGWSDTATGTGTYFSSGKQLILSSNTTLYAQWSASPFSIDQTLTSDRINQDTNYWPVAARICNLSSVNTYSLTSTFNWTTTGTGIALVGSPTQSLGTLGLSTSTTPCKDVYYQIYVPLANNSALPVGQSQNRKYQITFTTGKASDNSNNPWIVNTSANRQIFIETSVQNANNLSVTSMTTSAPLSGSVAQVQVGETYTFTITATTGTNVRWAQISSYFDPSIFQILSATGVYAPSGGGTINGVLNNPCLLSFDTTLNYGLCTNSSNSVTESPSMTYKVLVTGVGNQSTFPANITGFYGTQTKYNAVAGTSISAINAYWPLATAASGPGKIIVSVPDTGTLISGTPSTPICTLGNTCTGSGIYSEGSVITLTESATSGNVFAGWGGDCAGTSVTCKIKMDRIRNVTALFGAGVYPLSVSLIGEGTGSVSASAASPAIACANTGGLLAGTCSGNYSGGTSITLTAKADPLMIFMGWSGACSITTDTCTVTMNSAKSVIANFAIDPMLTVSIAATSGSKTVLSGDSPQTINCISDNANGTTGFCTGHYAVGQSITLTAASGIVSWSVAPASSISTGCTSGTTCTLVLMVDTQITAVYSGTPVSVVIDSASTGSGSVTSGESPAKISNCGGLNNPICSAIYAANTAVVLTESILTGSSFTGWKISGTAATSGCTSASTTCAFTTTVSTVVTAQFSLITTLNLNTTGTGTGTISGTPALTQSSGIWSKTFAASPADTQTLSGTPSTGSTFTGWSGGSCSGTSTCVITMNQDRYVTATFTLSTYTVTYDTQGGSATSTGTYTYGGTITLPSAPTRTGYTFAGWFTTSASGTALTSPYTPGTSSDITLFAHWTAETQTITYNSNIGGGSTTTSQSAGTGSVVTLLGSSTFSRPGYTLTRWDTSTAGSGSSYTLAQNINMPAGGLTLYAVWTVASQTITYSNNNGSGTVANTTGNTDSIVSLSDGAGFSRSGYTLSRWDTSTAGTGGSYTLSQSITMPAGGLNLYAVWSAQSQTITYGNNNGSGTIANTTGNTATSVSLSDGTGFSRAGYTLSGWDTSSSGATVVYGKSASIMMPVGGLNLYAVWSAQSQTITYNSNIGGGSTTTTQTGNTGSSINLLGASTFSRSGYTLSRWDTSTAGSGINYPFTPAITMPAGGLTLYAIWTINSYTLTYVAGSNGSITGTSPQTVTYGNSGASVTATAASGYHFVNWNDGSTSNPRTDSNVSGNISVTANFTADGMLNLSYVAGVGGTISGSSNQSLSSGVSGTAVTATPSTGYHFVNWNDSSVTASRTDSITADTTFTASFVINTFSITPSVSGSGSISPSSSTIVNYGSNQSFSFSPASGYQVTAVTVDSVTVSPTPTSPYQFSAVTANHVIQVTFAAIPTYSVSYSITASGALGTAPTNANLYQSTATFAVVAGTGVSRVGYSFAGWWDGSQQYTVGSNYTVASAVISFSDRWTANSVTYAYDLNYIGSSSAPSGGSTTSGGTFTTAATPSRSGYTFTHWNTLATGSGTSYNANVSSTMIASDTLVTLFAGWSADTQTITYNSNVGGGSTTTTQTGDTGSSINLRGTSTFSRTGYTLSRWDTLIAGTGINYSFTPAIIMPAGGLTLYAIWIAASQTIAYLSGVATGSIPNTTGDTGVNVQISPGTGFSRSGYELSGWDTATAGTSVVYNKSELITMPAGGLNLYAVWSALTRYSVSYSANPPTGTSSTGSAPTDSNTYYFALLIPIATNSGALAISGYTFVGWNTDPNSSTNITTLAMGSTPVTLYAVWNNSPSIYYTLTATRTGSGSVQSDSGSINLSTLTSKSDSYTVGASVLLTATPETSWQFVGWTITPSGAALGCIGTSRTCSLTLSSDVAVVAIFTLKVVAPVIQIMHELRLIQVGQGSISSSDGHLKTNNSVLASLYIYSSGTFVTMVAVPDSGYAFSGWRSTGGTCIGTANCSTANGWDETFTATFNIIPPTLNSVSMSVLGAYGSFTSSPSGIISCRDTSGTCAATFTSGTQVTFTANPDENGEFYGWGGDCPSFNTTSSCILVIDNAKSIVGYFRGTVVIPKTTSIILPITPPAVVIQKGSPMVLTNKVETVIDLTVVEGSNGLIIQTDQSWYLSITSSTQLVKQTKPSTSSVILIKPGNSVITVGSGFKPNSEVFVYVFSDPLLLGTIFADSRGEFTLTLPMPPSLEAGTHIFQVNGITSAGEIRSASVPIVLLPNQGEMSQQKQLEMSKQKISVFFGPYQYKLGVKEKHALTKFARSIKAKLSDGGMATVIVTGWVQPTKINNNAFQLSHDRAIAVVTYLRALKLKVKYQVVVGGLGKQNRRIWRRANALAEVQG